MDLRCAFILVIFTLCVEGLITRNRFTRQSRAITNFDINNSIQRLEKNIRILENKLSRHEFREAQVADFSTKTLNSLTADHGLNQKNMQVVAKQLGSMEVKLLSLEELVKTTDERQRKKLDSLSDGLNRLIMLKSRPDGGLPPFPGGGNPLLDREIKKVLRKINAMEGNLEQNAKQVDNEVKNVGETLVQHIQKLNDRQDNLLNKWNTCQKDHIRSITDVSSSLSKTGTLFEKQVTEAKKLLKLNNKAKECSVVSNEIVDKLDSLDKAYHDQEKDLANLNKNTVKMLQDQGTNIEQLLKESDNEKDMFNSYFTGVYDNLKDLGAQSKHHLGELEVVLNNIIKENSQGIRKRVESLASVLNDRTNNIINAIEDSAGTVENMQYSITDNFEELAKNIRGLKKVEQVMLNTADAVLDTKRSIEFGIQQVILELSATVKNSGRNIDSTLSDHISNISFAILKNQTMALTNMTQKMENEISRVWRQIGIMYQQISHSVDILDELQSTTSQQMNASYNKVDTMDGTVGAINNKVADVEDNLNYLLGRLSLVVSEFSHMKIGVGSELEKLREMAKLFSDGGIVEYEVNKKRSIRDEDLQYIRDNRKMYI